MSTDLFRGLPVDSRGGLLLNQDTGAVAGAASDDPFTRGITRDRSGRLLANVGRVIHVAIPAQATAGNVGSTLAGLASAGIVTEVQFIAAATITGVATNNRKFALVNLGQAGAGTTEVAGITFASGTNAAAGVATTVPLSGTPASLLVADDDVLSVVETRNGTGLTHGGGILVVKIAGVLA